MPRYISLLVVALVLKPTAAAADCAVQRDIDFPGNDLQSFHGTNADACCSKCQQTSGCAAYTYRWAPCVCVLLIGQCINSIRVLHF